MNFNVFEVLNPSQLLFFWLAACILNWCDAHRIHVFSPLMCVKDKMKSCLEAFGHRNPHGRDTCSTEESELGVSFLLAQKHHEACGKSCPWTHTGHEVRKGSFANHRGLAYQNFPVGVAWATPILMLSVCATQRQRLGSIGLNDWGKLYFPELVETISLTPQAPLWGDFALLPSKGGA